jgi:hypothetical protein
MKYPNTAFVYLLPILFVVSACAVLSGDKTNRKQDPASESRPASPAINVIVETPALPLPSEMPVATQVDYTPVVGDFSGKWIAYSVIPLHAGQPAVTEPGMRLDISPTWYVVDSRQCDSPEFESKQITLEDFLEGAELPGNSQSYLEEKFLWLKTGCPELEPSSMGLVNPVTLAARIGDDLIYFERDPEITRGSQTITTDLLLDGMTDPKVEIHAQVPVINQPGSQKFNPLAHSMVDSQIDGFKKNFIDWDIPPEMVSTGSFMWIKYEVTLLTPELVSIRFGMDTYMAGAAHPNHNFMVLNYDLVNDNEIKFTDLFKNPEEALKILSIASKNNLSSDDFPLFEEGLQPIVENFSNWNLQENALRLSFDPYQVAPYAAGPQEVNIPYRDIWDLVNLDSPAGDFIFNGDQ